MKTLFNALLFCLVLVPSTLAAQTTVKGTVTDEANEMPLPGVNVIIKGTSRGTSTDFDGNFSLDISDGETVVISYLGYTTKEIVYSGQNPLNISLAEDASQLEEVVLIGYGSVKKDDLTGAADLLKSEDFNQGPVVSTQQLISGKIAGVSVTSGSGAPGDGQEILIRGVGSLSLNRSPLIVVDGFPLNNDNVGGSRNPLNFINPNDIESLVVLKDASATAIYGSRGGNGVILITTKKGKNRGFKFNVTSSTTIHTSRDRVDVLTAEEFRNIVPTNPQANEDTLALIGNANTDWQDEIYTTAFGQDHNISALGSAFGIPMRASIGYSDHDGILKRDNFKRTTASVALTPSLLDDHLKIELNARGNYTENFFANRGAIGAASVYDPTQPVFDSNSPYDGYFDWVNPQTGNHNSLAPINPVAQLNLVDDTAEVRRFIGNAKFDYKLHFFPDLTATVNVGIDKSNSNGRTATSILFPTSDTDWNGSLNKYSQERTDKLFDAYLTYNKSFNDVHNLTLVAGYSYQSFEFNGYSYDSVIEEEAIADPDADIRFEFIDSSKSVLLSYFGRLNYDYDGKYLLTATFRADASSKLNGENRWDFFPSAAFAWNIHKENFINTDGFLNELKLRLGFGEVGNTDGLGNYLFLTRYTRSNSFANYQFGYNTDGSPAYFQTYRPSGINENLRWEISRTFNAGIDYSIFNRRISGSINAYVRQNKDLIAQSTVDPFTNFTNRIDSNIGDMENKGIELLVNATPIKTDDFEWSLSYNVAFNDNKVTRLPDQQFVGGISGGVGNRIQTHIEGESPYSFLVYQQVYDTNGKPIEGAFVDRNGDNIINDEDKFIYKDPYADVIMGLNTNLNYKKWDLAIVTRANIGNYAYNNVASGNSYLENIVPSDNNFLSNIHSDYLNTGFVDSNDSNLYSNYFIQNASFFKVDNITLGYTFDKAIKDTVLRVYGSMQNVATITDYDGIDPEINGGIDNGFYPRPQSFLLGVNIDF